MGISPCSRLWTDINIHVHRKEITNCCRRRQKRIPTVEDFKKLGADFWLLRPEVKQDKEHFLEARDFPVGCGECGEYHPDSRYTTHNKWVDMDESFYENLGLEDHVAQIEIGLSSLCNMTCMYCIPEVSSQWAKKLGIAPLETDKEWEDAMFESLYAFIEKKLTQVGRVSYTFLGGEPLLEPRCLEIMEKISELHHASQTIRIEFVHNGNVGPSTLQKFIDLTQKYDYIEWEVSLSTEAIGERAEHIREGLSWKRFETNLCRLLEQTDIKVCILPSWNALAIPTMLEFHKWALDLFLKYRDIDGLNHTWGIHMNTIYHPSPMNVGILPVEFRKYCDETIEWIESIIGDRTTSWRLNTYLKQIEGIRNNIGKIRDPGKLSRVKKWYKEQEKIHNRKYWETFPELYKVFDGVI